MQPAPNTNTNTDEKRPKSHEFTFGTDEGDAPLDADEYLEGPPPPKTEDDD